MKLIVTGGAGFIGSHFIRYWLAEHPRDSIVNIDALTYAGNLSNLNDVETNHPLRYTFVDCDITKENHVFDIFSRFRPDVVVHFAAESHNSYALKNPGKFFTTNVLGTQILLDISRKIGVDRFHHVSTCEVYGDLPLDSDEMFSEHYPLSPRTPYNASKAGSDLAALAYHQTFELPVTISRCANNYGSHQMPEKVIPRFVTQAILGEKLTPYRSSSHLREWLHVVDHCTAIDAIIHQGRAGEIYNIGSGVELSIADIVRRVQDFFDLNEDAIEFIDDRPGHDRRYLLDCTKIQETLGWKPVVIFDRGFETTISWYVQHQTWWISLFNKMPVDEKNW